MWQWKPTHSIKLKSCQNDDAVNFRKTITFLAQFSWKINGKNFDFCLYSKGPQMHQYIDWPNSMTNHRNTFHVVNRVRMRQFYRQKPWKPFLANGHNQMKSNGNGFGNGFGNSCGILWELAAVNRRIQIVSNEIFILNQQLRIIKSYYGPVPATKSDNSEYSPRYLPQRWCAWNLWNVLIKSVSLFIVWNKVIHLQ